MKTIYVVKETYKFKDKDERNIKISQKLAEIMRSDNFLNNEANFCADKNTYL
ncbi:hypothetical protein [Anaerovorax odorimutans]|uniref:hypothetical protein n=1 Tax=Anaerovorax odorimutans TaxID=109327 RepID=UPI000421E9ED|nr:hypothetical protein [Anaerovorax odorimutans]